MIVSKVHQIKTYQTFNYLISSFKEYNLFSTDEQQDEVVNEEENHSMDYEKKRMMMMNCFSLNWIVISQVLNCLRLVNI